MEPKLSYSSLFSSLFFIIYYIYKNNLSATNTNKKSTASSRRSGKMCYKNIYYVINFSKTQNTLICLRQIHYLIKNMNINFSKTQNILFN